MRRPASAGCPRAAGRSGAKCSSARGGSAWLLGLLDGHCGANSLRTERRAQQGVHPFAITPVDKDFWEAWYAQHKDRDFVKNGLVFVAKDEKDAQAMARERLPERTGLEGLNTDLKNEPRMPKSSNPNTTVEADREHLKSLGVAA